MLPVAAERIWKLEHQSGAKRRIFWSCPSTFLALKVQGGPKKVSHCD